MKNANYKFDGRYDCIYTEEKVEKEKWFDVIEHFDFGLFSKEKAIDIFHAYSYDAEYIISAVSEERWKSATFVGGQNDNLIFKAKKTEDGIHVTMSHKYMEWKKEHRPHSMMIY